MRANPARDAVWAAPAAPVGRVRRYGSSDSRQRNGVHREHSSDTSAVRERGTRATSDVIAGAKPLVERVKAAVAGGARSWAAVGREAGCSRQWAQELGGRARLALAGAGPCRDATLSVRVRAGAVSELDAFAAAETARTGRAVSRSDAARLLLTEALAARRR